MGWKWVMWAGCLVPVLAGCGSLRHPTLGPARGPTRLEVARDQRRDARAAWQAVRDRNPERAFTDEFRDGFLDGYSDYFDRGTAAVPGKYRYAQDNLAAAAPVRDYSLGFHYAAEVANASGRQPGVALSAPADAGASPEPAVAPRRPVVPATPVAAKPAPAKITPPAGGSDLNKFDSTLPPGAGRPPEPETYVPPLPKPELPIIKPFDPPLPDPAGSKFVPREVPPSPDLLPAPSPPLPVALPIPPVGPLEPVPRSSVPSILDELPPIPFRLPVPPPAPPLNGPTAPAPQN